MGIQIEENKLSQEAQKALRNAKNKSQFMRDAIEYYVRKEPVAGNFEFSKDIKDIKSMLATLMENGIQVTESSKQAPMPVAKHDIEKAAAVPEQKVEPAVKAAPVIRSSATPTGRAGTAGEGSSNELEEVGKLIDQSLGLFVDEDD